MTEIFISIDGLEYTKLDLSKDESILMKYTQKDLQDISKIFAPYSQNFNFPATPKNRMAFGFFGDTDIIKINTDNKFKCKIYTDGVLNLSGFVVLSELSYVNNIPDQFTGNFATSMVNLRDRIGEDSIKDLSDNSLTVDWTFKNVFSLVKGIKNTLIDTVKATYFVPLISNNRVWSMDSTFPAGLKDNISYNSSRTADDINLIQSTELRPAVSFSTIIDLIIKKYGLLVTCPLFLRKEYSDLYVYCNNGSIYTTKSTLLTVKNAFGSRITQYQQGFPPELNKYTATANTTTNSFKVTRLAMPFDKSEYYNTYFNFKINLTGVAVTGGSVTTEAIVTLKRKGTGDIIVSNTFGLSGTAFNCSFQIDDNLFIGNEIEFEAHVSFNQPLSWSNCEYLVEYRYYRKKQLHLSPNFGEANYAYQSTPNNNSLDISATSIDLLKSLPDVKIVDFLSSFFKAFNISVLDTSPNDENLYWLTPSDMQTSGLAYSKTVLDYTPYVDISSYKKSVPTDYNYYNFKHATSKYRSNVDYKKAAILEYGQAVNPAVKPTSAKEFKVETNFSVIVPVVIPGSNTILTHYGFTADAGEVIDTGETRYKPNFGELTVFYSHGSVEIGVDRKIFGLLVRTGTLGFKSTNNSGVNINASLSSHIKVAPWNSEGDSFAFSVLTDYSNNQYPISLYLKGYDAQTARLLDTNVLSQEYTFSLPSNEIYLNEATTIQGAGLTPTGFRLQNEIIIGETRFTIVDANIDITTGKAQLTLLNF